MKRIILIAALFILCVSAILFASERGIKTISGEVVAVDYGERSILVKKVIGKNELVNGGKVDENTEILISGKRGTLEDIKVKDNVTLFMTIKDEDVYVKKIVKK
ncbi:MAG TPA: hypothetical protein PLW88_07040 [Syntrophorhabdaceae bacterium]|nr:hypothetical protein [Syntrophorhabdaceae bacterium]HPP07111.1 hypothetical protein [Syntrophorhabdaceae bacterium]